MRRPPHQFVSLLIAAVFAAVSGGAVISAKAPAAGDRDEPVVLPTVQFAQNEQPPLLPKRTMAPGAIASVDRDFKSIDRPKPEPLPSPPAADVRSFA